MADTALVNCCQSFTWYAHMYLVKHCRLVSDCMSFEGWKLVVLLTCSSTLIISWQHQECSLTFLSAWVMCEEAAGMLGSNHIWPTCLKLVNCCLIASTVLHHVFACQAWQHWSRQMVAEASYKEILGVLRGTSSDLQLCVNLLVIRAEHVHALWALVWYSTAWSQRLSVAGNFHHPALTADASYLPTMQCNWHPAVISFANLACVEQLICHTRMTASRADPC